MVAYFASRSVQRSEGTIYSRDARLLDGVERAECQVFNYTERTPNRLLSDIIAEGSNWIQAGAMKLAAIGWPQQLSLGGASPLVS